MWFTDILETAKLFSASREPTNFEVLSFHQFRMFVSGFSQILVIIVVVIIILYISLFYSFALY